MNSAPIPSQSPWQRVALVHVGAGRAAMRLRRRVGWVRSSATEIRLPRIQKRQSDEKLIVVAPVVDDRAVGGIAEQRLVLNAADDMP